jgi:phosphoribosylanthranilate isomerase
VQERHRFPTDTAIGFNFYPKSPRFIAPEQAARIDTPGAQRVGVFVNEPAVRIAEIARIVRENSVQTVELMGWINGNPAPRIAPR